MTRDKTSILNEILDGYAPYFDIERDTVLNGLPIAAEATFHSREEKYVLTKSVKIWSAEHNEYTFFIVTKCLTQQILQAYFDTVLHEGMRRVNPKEDHMCSLITLIVLTDTADTDVPAMIQKMKYYKSFCFSLRGWVHFRVAALEISSGKKFSNRMGKDVLQSLNRLLKPRRLDVSTDLT